MFLKFYRSTIGKKIIVAVTGLMMFGFVTGHLLGNLQVFLGAEKLNDYAAFLKRELPLLWAARLTLLLSVLTHADATVQLTLLNRRSRPVPYRQHEMIQATYASRTMIWGGVFLAFYVVFHICHLTLGVGQPLFSQRNVYANVVRAFSSWPVSLFYILGMIALGFHLYHGIQSAFQTLGLNHPKYNGVRRVLGMTAACLISLGYISIPVSVMLGIVRW